MFKSSFVVAALFIAGFIYLIHEDSEAAKRCRKDHSEETCFYIFNH